MSILIKGIKMPKNCESCPCKTAEAFGGLGCQATGYIPLREINQDRPDNCPLNLIPPHGRCIDADELAKEMKNMAKDFPPGSIGAERYRLFVEIIKTAPTIIPAEEGECDAK